MRCREERIWSYFWGRDILVVMKVGGVFIKNLLVRWYSEDYVYYWRVSRWEKENINEESVGVEM